MSVDPNLITLISCRDVWNAFLLPYLIEIMKPTAQEQENNWRRDEKEREEEEMLKMIKKMECERNEKRRDLNLRLAIEEFERRNNIDR